MLPKVHDVEQLPAYHDDLLIVKVRPSAAPLVAAAPEPFVVVLPVVVGVPEVEQRARERPAIVPEHAPGDLDARARHARLDERGALRRARLEEWPLGLGRRRLIVVAAVRRGWKSSARGRGPE